MTAEADSRLHTSETFAFVANATEERIFPLFGAEMERAWAEDWNPQFIWPANAEDCAGMVFKLAHGDRTGIWVNTAFDRLARNIQYVYVVPDLVATLITINLTPHGDSTQVSIRYDRTSLSASADAIVRELAEHDSIAGTEWAMQINRHLAEETRLVRR